MSTALRAPGANAAPCRPWARHQCVVSPDLGLHYSRVPTPTPGSTLLFIGSPQGYPCPSPSQASS